MVSYNLKSKYTAEKFFNLFQVASVTYKEVDWYKWTENKQPW